MGQSGGREVLFQCKVAISRIVNEVVDKFEMLLVILSCGLLFFVEFPLLFNSLFFLMKRSLKVRIF